MIDAGLGAEPPGGLGDRAIGLGPAIAEIDQRRDRIGERTRGCGDGAIRRGHAGGERQRANLVLELGDDAAGKLGADAAGPRQARLVLARHGAQQLVGVERALHRQRDAGADALDGDQQAEPVARRSVGEAVEMDVVLADMSLDQQADRLSRRRQAGQRAAGGEHQIADAADIDNRPVDAGLVDEAGELGDHARPPAARPGTAAACQCRAVPAWWAWQIATASASAASALVDIAPGSRWRTMTWTCSLAAWPTPTTDFLIRFAGYSVTGSPASAGTSKATPRATPSLS